MAVPPAAGGPQGADAAEGRLAVRLEIVEVEGLAGLPEPLRGALTVCGHPVYVGEGPLTEGAVRLAQLPPAADLAVALLSAAGDAVLATAPLPLSSLHVGAAEVEAEDLPPGSRACQAWLPLLPARAGPGAPSGAARVLASVVFEGPPPGAAPPLPTPPPLQPQQPLAAPEDLEERTVAYATLEERLAYLEQQLGDDRQPPCDPVPLWLGGERADALSREESYHDELFAASAPRAPAPAAPPLQPAAAEGRAAPRPATAARAEFHWPRLDARPDGAPVLDAPEMPPGDLSLADLKAEGRARQVPCMQARSRAALGAAGALVARRGPREPEGQLVQEALGRLYAQLLEAASGAAVQNLLGALSALLPQLGGGCGEGAALHAASVEVETEIDLTLDARPPSPRHGLARAVAVV